MFLLSPQIIVFCFLAINFYLYAIGLRCHFSISPIIGPHPSQRQTREKALLSVKAISFSQRNNMCESICAVFIRFENVYPLTRFFFAVNVWWRKNSDESTEQINKSENNKSISGSNVFFGNFSHLFRWWKSLIHKFCTHNVIDMQFTIQQSVEAKNWNSYIVLLCSDRS